jgi:hypothetical protein
MMMMMTMSLSVLLGVCMSVIQTLVLGESIVSQYIRRCST